MEGVRSAGRTGCAGLDRGVLWIGGAGDDGDACAGGKFCY